MRAPAAADLAALPAIELSGDAMFAELGIVFPPGPAAVETAIAHGAGILVAGDPPVAFAAVIALDGHPHLEQISVRTDQTRNGIGSLLLAGVVRRYGPGLTLLTFRDVPWNGPWYLRHGFAEFPRSAWGPELQRHWQAGRFTSDHVPVHDLDAARDVLGQITVFRLGQVVGEVIEPPWPAHGDHHRTSRRVQGVGGLSSRGSQSSGCSPSKRAWNPGSHGKRLFLSAHTTCRYGGLTKP